MFFCPWYFALLLAIESGSVVELRLRSLATGRVDAREEAWLMVGEKLDAAIKAGSMIMNGSRPAEVLNFYRLHVAANAARLA